MMQESRLTNLQKRRITDCLQSRFERLRDALLYYFKNVRDILISPFSSEGTSLPLTFDSPLPAPPCEPKTVQKRLSARPQRRSAEACRSGDGYAREKFCPGPTSGFLKQRACIAKFKWLLLLNLLVLDFFFLLFRRLREREKAASEYYVNRSRRRHTRAFKQRSQPRHGGERQISRRYK